MLRTCLLTAILLIPAFAGEPDWNRILQPSALRDKHGPASVDELRKLFTNPPAEYRTAPLWVWNDELEWPRLEEQLTQYKKLGFGGAFVHPRPGLMTEYFGPEWFDLWKRSLDLAKKLGLKLHIYDENSYPAGFSGGHVPALAPETAGKVLMYEWRVSAEGLPWTSPATVAIFAVKRDAEGVPVSFQPLRQDEPLPAGHSILVTRIEQVDPGAWTAGFPYVDITNPRTTELFLETTYEAYKKLFGNEFGKTILWGFSDEPEFSKKSNTGLPLNFRILSEFRRRLGYDLAAHIPSLYWDTGDYRRVRFDYWQLLHTLLTEAFFEPMFSWCDRNNLGWTGHWWEHLWPYPWLTPSDMSFYAFEHMPGIDLLGFQTFNLDESGVEPHMLFTIKQVASAANQLNRPRVLSETYGGGGWRYTMEQMKRSGDYEIVHGVNLVNQHLSYGTTRGARKRDWPQSFSDAAAWWPYYRIHADHTARLSLAMTAGRARNRVLLLNPSTSAFLLARRSENNNADLEKLKSDHEALVQFLSDHQIDYDLGDEYLMDWFGSVDSGKLEVGVQSYSVIIWPHHMTNVRTRTAELLGEFTASGGTIVALGDPAQFIDGRPGQFDSRSWTRVASHEALLAAVEAKAAPRLTANRELTAVGFAERFLDDGSRLVLLNNAGPAPLESIVTLQGGVVEEWDSTTGEIRPYPADRHSDGRSDIRVELPPAGSLLLSVRDGDVTEIAEPAVPWVKPLPPAEWTAAAESPNVLVLDFCDLEVNGFRHDDLLVMEAAKVAYREHGFDSDPWESAVQFRTDILDRNDFGDDSGFTATFRFTVTDAAATEGLELAVEAPELYTIRVNRQPVDFTGAERWLDPHLLRVPIADLATTGVNTIEITGKPFDVRMELEAIYLRGNFTVRPIAKGFELAAPADLKLGPWSRQGRPFDTATALYTATLEVPPDTSALRVSLGGWHGSVAELLIDGKQAAVLGWPPYQAETPITPGSHEIAIRVVATPRNIYGPFHDPRPDVARVLWPGHWSLFANIHQPSGADYEVEEYGLFAPPALALVK